MPNFRNLVTDEHHLIGDIIGDSFALFFVCHWHTSFSTRQGHWGKADESWFGAG